MIAFVINFYDEPTAQVQAAIDRVAVTNPGCEIVGIGDGVRKDLKNCRWIEFHERLKQAKCGGRWTHRYLEFMLESTDATAFIKIDPDTNTLLPVPDEPTGEAVFCRVQEHILPGVHFRAPRGGALGYTRLMAERIVRSGYFLDPRLANNPRYGAYQDIMLMDIIAKNHLTLIDRRDFTVSCGEAATTLSTFWHK